MSHGSLGRHLGVRAAVGFLLLSTLAACADLPSSTAPIQPPASASADELPGGCTPTMIICDDGSTPTWQDDGFEEATVYEASGALMDQIPMDAALAAPVCPSYAYGIGLRTTLSAPRPDGNFQSVTISTTGTWSWWGEDGPSSAMYNWPPGYWPAVDGSGAEVSIGTAHGNCYPLTAGMVAVRLGPPFRWVNARWPRRRGEISPTSGGGGGGGDSCQMEYIIVEINYGDGTGWHELWEGWASVCG